MILLQDISFSISFYFVLLTPGKKNSIVVKIIEKKFSQQNKVLGNIEKFA